MSAICPVCSRRVRVTRLGSLVQHVSHYATTCPNSGSELHTLTGLQRERDCIRR
jgi:hypothetical protein